MRSIGHRFEQFVFGIFKSVGFDGKLISQPTESGVDIEINKGSNKYGIEAKFYRSRRIPISTIKASLIQLQYTLQRNDYEGGFLVSTANVEPSIREVLKKDFQIEILDRGILISLTNGHENLRKELEEILLELSQSGDEDIYDGVFSVSGKYDINFIEFKKPMVSKIDTGEELCKELTLLSKGRSTAKQYEAHCEKILKYAYRELCQ